jgi:DNA-binding Xre family transcriptional regulator
MLQSATCRKVLQYNTMSQSQAMIQTLKKVIRQQGKTYKDVAVALALSEASVKRLFAEKTFSLERFERVCEFVGIQISELIGLMEKQSLLISSLTHEQEKELVADTHLLLVAVCSLNHWTYDDIITTYTIDEFEGIQLMAKLDRMKIIQLQPGNRVKRMVDRSFSWLPNGPIQRFFERSVQSDFFKSTFNGPGEFRVFFNGMLSRKSNQEMVKKAQRLVQDFNHFHADDESLPLDERHGTSMVLAMRPWELKIFADLRRAEDKKVF